MTDHISDEPPNGKAGGSDPAGSIIPDGSNSAKHAPDASPPRQLSLADAGVPLPLGSELRDRAMAGFIDSAADLITTGQAAFLDYLRLHGRGTQPEAMAWAGIRLPEHLHPGAWGAIACGLAKRGRIRRVCARGRQVERAPQRQAHARPVQVWELTPETGLGGR